VRTRELVVCKSPLTLASLFFAEVLLRFFGGISLIWGGYINADDVIKQNAEESHQDEIMCDFRLFNRFESFQIDDVISLF